MRTFWEETKYTIVSALVVLAICVAVPVLVVSIFSQTNAEQQDAARCKSLQGEYGGGKCFKDGKEI